MIIFFNILFRVFVPAMAPLSRGSSFLISLVVPGEILINDE